MNCYLCGSDRVTVIRNRLRHNVTRNVLLCQSCGLNYLEPRSSDLRDYYAEEYRNTYSPKTSEAADSQAIFDIYSPLQAERIERLKPYLPATKSGRALDVGASAGHFLYALKPYYDKLVGIEYNQANAQFMRDKLGFRAYTTPLEETDLPEGYFDLITVFHTLEHMPDPVAFLQTARRYLKPDGWLYVEVPNVDDALLSAYKSEPFADFWYREPHLFNFSPRTLNHVMNKAGLAGQVIPVQRYGFTNHLHWLMTGQPQPSAEVAMNIAPLVTDASVPAAARLNEWIKRVDAEYRAILRECEISESIGFIAQPTRE